MNFKYHIQETTIVVDAIVDAISPRLAVGIEKVHGVGRVVVALGSKAGFAGSMLGHLHDACTSLPQKS